MSKDDLIEQVEACVEDFYGDVDMEPDDIPTYSVEDVFNSNDIPAKQQDKLWDELVAIASEKYQSMYDNDHRS